MNIKYILFAIIAVGLSVFSACKKEESLPTKETGSVTLEFDNTVNGAPLALNTKNYTNSNGDTFNVSTFKYYVSNITLTATDGAIFKIPESYLLVDASKPSSLVNNFAGIPAGDYENISFTIGVDKERNLAGAQTGALDPALGMFWTWNSGYIFVKMEGTSPQSTATNKNLTFHIGGIFDPDNTIRTFTTALPSNNPIRIRSDKNPQLHFKVNAASLFTGKQQISFANLHTTMGGPTAVVIANNYVDGLFKLDHVHN